MLRKLLQIIKLVALALFLIVALAPEWPAFSSERYRLETVVGQRKFDFVGWGIEAVGTKLEGMLGGGHQYMAPAERKEIVLAYLELLGQVGQLSRQIEGVYADPAVADPAGASADLQAELAAKRAELARQQPLFEAIIQEQVAAVLIDEGFSLAGQVWPPVQMKMTPLPLILVVSPRDEIRQKYGVPLTAGLSTAEQEALETRIYEELDLSALVVPIGGLGMFPAMILETSSINFLADVVAHEWAHHWLTMHPLGLGYGLDPQLRTINETVASIVGTEVGEKVIEQLYPEYVPPPVVETTPPPPLEPGTEPPFDFRAEMAITRLEVDRLLAEGEIEAAEAYMETRRHHFVANGYNIRKLNQAYFAFYGAYADTPGATGGDPIGPTLLGLRAQSSSLREFMDRVSGVTSFEALQELLIEPMVE